MIEILELKRRDRKSYFFLKNGWKPSQKMRLDALIIFHIAWQHKVSSLIGKQSEYWSKKGKTENHVLRMAGNHLKRCVLMRWSFSILNDSTKYLVWWLNNRNTDAKKARPKDPVFFRNGWKPSQKMRLDALIIFLIEWPHQVSIPRGKQSKYWS